MKRNTLSKIFCAAAALLLSGSFAVAGGYFHLEPREGDAPVPGRVVLTGQGDAFDIAPNDDRIGNVNGRVLRTDGRGYRVLEQKPQRQPLATTDPGRIGKPRFLYLTACLIDRALGRGCHF